VRARAIRGPIGHVRARVGRGSGRPPREAGVHLNRDLTVAPVSVD